MFWVTVSKKSTVRRIDSIFNTEITKNNLVDRIEEAVAVEVRVMCVYFKMVNHQYLLQLFFLQLGQAFLTIQ